MKQDILEIATAICAFTFIGCTACFLINMFHLQFGSALIWLAGAVISGFIGLNTYNDNDNEKE